MIKAQFKTFGFWLVSVATTAGVITFLSGFFVSGALKEKNLYFIGGLIIILFFGSQLWRDGKLISIDTFSKTIKFTNLISRRHFIYSFDEFDGFIDMLQPSREGDFKVIYLVKDRKFIRKISSFYYSNLEEMQEGLSKIKYLGLQKFDYLKSIKILFGMPVLA